MTTYEVYVGGAPLRFNSDLTPEDAIRILSAQKNLSDFGLSLVTQAKAKPLSIRQLSWLIKLAQDINDRSSRIGQYKSIPGLLNSIPTARFKITLRLIEVSKPAATSLNAGFAYVALLKGGYIGKIDPEGHYMGRGMPMEALTELEDLAKNPVHYAIQCGRETGKCSCCGRTLSDPISVASGIGPVCLERIAGKKARKLMEDTFASNGNLIQQLVSAGIIKDPCAKPDCEAPPTASEFPDEHDFMLANAISKL